MARYGSGAPHFGSALVRPRNAGHLQCNFSLQSWWQLSTRWPRRSVHHRADRSGLHGARGLWITRSKKTSTLPVHSHRIQISDRPGRARREYALRQPSRSRMRKNASQTVKFAYSNVLGAWGLAEACTFTDIAGVIGCRLVSKQSLHCLRRSERPQEREGVYIHLGVRPADLPTPCPRPCPRRSTLWTCIIFLSLLSPSHHPPSSSHSPTARISRHSKAVP